jgi:hypothetical protein
VVRQASLNRRDGQDNVSFVAQCKDQYVSIYEMKIRLTFVAQCKDGVQRKVKMK